MGNKFKELLFGKVCIFYAVKISECVKLDTFTSLNMSGIKYNIFMVNLNNCYGKKLYTTLGLSLFVLQEYI